MTMTDPFVSSGRTVSSWYSRPHHRLLHVECLFHLCALVHLTSPDPSVLADRRVVSRASRMSILFSIIRLIPYMMRMRYWAYLFAVLFGLMWLSLIILKLAICETDTAWKKSPGVQCVLGPAVGGVELASTLPCSQPLTYLPTYDICVRPIIADFIADIILVLMPMRLLWHISLSTSRRSLLTGIFSASMFTTIVSIVHGVYVFSHNRNAEGIWAHVLVRLSVLPILHYS